MRLLTAIDEMTAALVEADASDRQLIGVGEWRASVAAAVVIGSQYPKAPGMTISNRPRRAVRGWDRPSDVRFLHGHETHAAWRDLCGAINAALDQQETYAKALVRLWAARAAKAQTTAAHVRAVRQARIAHSWVDAAAAAQQVGRELVAAEDAVHVPVGRVIRRIGAQEVAADKYYHQRGARR